jgi:hypothetical protein
VLAVVSTAAVDGSVDDGGGSAPPRAVRHMRRPWRLQVPDG